MAEVFISNNAGRVPTVNQLELATAQMGYNRVDALLYGLKVVGGVKSVVCLGESIDPGSTHDRLHAMDSALDHAADTDHKGYIPYTDPDTGAWTLISASGSFIQNQNAASQTANYHISGSGYIDTNLGVGISSSLLAKVHVVAASGKAAIFDGSDANGYNTWIKGTQAGIVMGHRLNAAENGYMGLIQAVSADGNSWEGLAINPNGGCTSVGTAYEDPDSKLMVIGENVASKKAIWGLNYNGDGSSALVAQSYITTSNGTAYGLKALIDNATSRTGTNVAGYFSASGAGTTNYSIITGTGYAGLATDTPTRQLDINGALRIRTITNQTGYANILVADNNGNVDYILKSTFLTAEADTLQTVTDRGASSTNVISVPSAKFTTGATVGYYWKCTNADGSGAWYAGSAADVYIGTWDASTNTPTLDESPLTPASATAGWWYRCIAGGTVDFGSGNITFAAGDDVYYNGTNWAWRKNYSYTLIPATASVLGGVIIGSNVSVAGDGTISVHAPVTIASGSTGALSLSTQELSIDGDLVAIAAITGTTGLLKKTAVNTWELDTTAYNTGTVTSVALSLPAQFSVSGSPVTTSGTLTASWASQNQALVFASPAASSGAPSFRALVATDIPALNYAATSHTHDDRYYTETEIGNFFGGTTPITGYNKTNWDTAYGWGNHSGLYQPLDADLTAIAGLAGTTGLLRKTGANTWELDTTAYTTNTGTVTSVALSAPTQFQVGGSPITTSGTLALSWNTVTEAYVFAGDTTGNGSAVPRFRALVATDIPALNYAATNHTHSYLPLAGGTMDIDAGITFRTNFEGDDTTGRILWDEDSFTLAWDSDDQNMHYYILRGDHGGNTWLGAADKVYIDYTGKLFVNTTANSIVNVDVLATGSAATGIYTQAAGANGIAIYAKTTQATGTSVYGYNQSSGDGVTGYSESGRGGYMASPGGLPLHVFTNPSSTATSVRLLKLERQTTGAAAAGIGGHVSFFNEITGSSIEAGQYGCVMADVSGSADARFEWYLVTAGTLPASPQMTLTDGSLWVKSTVSTTLTQITDEGGFAIKLTAGEAIVKGNILGVGANGSQAYKIGANSDMPWGVAYNAASQGEDVWMVVSGMAFVLAKTGVTLTKGDVVFVSNVAGQADRSASVPVNEHWREVGHCIETGSSGGLGKCILHFN